MADAISSFYGNLGKPQQNDAVSSFYSTATSRSSTSSATPKTTVKTSIPSIPAPTGGFKIGDVVSNVLNTAKTFVQKAETTIGNLSNGIKASLTPPKIISPIQETQGTNIPSVNDFQVGQKKLTPSQMTQLQPNFTVGKTSAVSAQPTVHVQEDINKTKQLFSQLGIIASQNVLEPVMTTFPSLRKPIETFLAHEQNTPVSPLGVTPKMMKDYTPIDQSLYDHLPLVFKLSGLLTGFGQTKGLTNFVGDIAGLNPSLPNLVMAIAPEVTTMAGKALLTKFGNEAISFMANKELLYKVTTDTATSEELHQFDILNQSGILGEARKGISVTTLEPKQGAMWDLLRNIFPTAFTKDGQPIQSDLPKQIQGEIQKMDTQLAKTEYTPNEVINTVVNSNLKDTPDGKELMKVAVQAQKSGNNVMIETPPPQSKILGRAANVSDGLRESMATAKTPQEAIQKLNTFVSEFAKGADRQQLADLRAGLVKEVTTLTGGSGNYKKDYAMRVALRNDTEIGGLVRTLETHIGNIDDGTIQPQVYQSNPMQAKVSSVTPSKIAVSIERKAVEQGLTKGFEGLAGYDKVVIKDQAEKSSNLVNNDFERFKRIIRGQESIPEGYRGVALITAGEEYVKKTGDGELALDLANSPLVSGTSLAAQELRLAGERVQDSVTLKLQEIKKSREAKLKARTGKTTEKSIAEEIGKIKKQTPTVKREDWQSFVNSLEC